MLWSLKGVIVKNAKVEKVIDGDTLQIWLPVCCKKYIFSCRLRGINTPEIRTKDLDVKQKGLEAKAFVEKQIQEYNVEVHCFEFDKYGRVLCDVYLTKRGIWGGALFYKSNKDKLCLNTQLLDHSYAVKYP